MRLADVKPEELKPLVVMWRRAECIYEVANEIKNHRLNLDDLGRKPYSEAKNGLMKYKGIGSKIADCVLLFSLDKPQAFPIDTNIRQGIKRLYKDRFPTDDKPQADRKLLQWACQCYGQNAGYASQLIFRYERLQSGGT